MRRSGVEHNWPGEVLLFSTPEACLIKALCKPTLFEESLFKLPQLLVQKVISLMDEAHQCVGGYLWGRLFYIGLIGRIGPILLIGEAAHGLGGRMGLAPHRPNRSYRSYILFSQHSVLLKAEVSVLPDDYVVQHSNLNRARGFDD